MNLFVKKLHYYFQIFPLTQHIQNWPVIILAYLFPGTYILKLHSKHLFTINHHLDALTIKEIFIDQNYQPKGKKAQTIVDIGANIGSFSILMSSRFPKAKIYAYEPDNKTFDLLKENIQLNNCQNIYPVKQGVARKAGSAIFYSHPASGLSSLKPTRTGMKKSKIILTTLTKLIKDQNIKKIDILKIDAEGAEFEILLNSPKATFQKINEIILEYHDNLTPDSHEKIISKLHQQGYKVLIQPHPLESDIGIIHAY